MRLGLFHLTLCALLMSASGVCRAQDGQRLPENERLIGAAAIVLAGSTSPTGEITVVSPYLARSAGGATFRRLADCVYGEDLGSRGNAVIDFTGLIGAYRISRGARGMGVILTLKGVKPRTSCFTTAGDTGCNYDLVFSSIPAEQVHRVVDDVSFVHRSCMLRR